MMKPRSTDQSYLTDDDNSDVDDIVRQGTLRQMLESSRMENGKCLNAFFPGITGTSSTPFSSDRYAWRQTEGLPFCHEDSQYPTHDMRLGLAATKGTFHFWRLDSDGLGKYIDIMTGILWWIIARPRRSSKGFAKTTMYVDGFDPECPNLHLWDLEAVVLKPGDKMYVGKDSGSLTSSLTFYFKHNAAKLTSCHRYPRSFDLLWWILLCH